MSTETVNTVTTYVTAPTSIGVVGMQFIGYELEQWVVVGTLVMILLNFFTWCVNNIPKIKNFIKQYMKSRKEKKKNLFTQ